MQNNEEVIAKKISSLIKKARKRQSLSQKELASGICSQAMISSIENNEYLPNAALFLALCNKLGLSVDSSFLNHELQFTYNQKLSDKLFDFCKNHQYQDLLKYIDNSQVLSSLDTDLDYQIYYYYHGCSTYQLTRDLISCKRDFKLALSYTTNLEKPNPKTEIELLLLNSLGVINAELYKKKEAQVLFNIVERRLQKINLKSENLNVIFFQQGMVSLNQCKYYEAIKKFTQGIEFLEDNNSTFMLNSYFAKITECYQKSKQI